MLVSFSLFYSHHQQQQQQQRCSSPNHLSVLLRQPFFSDIPILVGFPIMASSENGRPLPKFGEWDVNDPASADGFTVIFNKARDEKKTGGGGAGNVTSPSKYAAPKETANYKYPNKSKWFCCF